MLDTFLDYAYVSSDFHLIYKFLYQNEAAQFI